MSYRPTWATVKKLVLQTDEDVAQLVVASLGSSLSSMVAHISIKSQHSGGGEVRSGVQINLCCTLILSFYLFVSVCMVSVEVCLQ